ncbi:SdpI family protein [Viridibacillus sp. YIM B01967]|uniref:SdpI family protein n=1 Tax=Viridibacillus soli TaxID=2798301 RepID=A0ABS1H6T5_9BACL|nr:SdpI family protein [Viridibacillus soli]MBK3495131.1 SdpI family protein [Viridibacillus soli]
MDTVLLNIGISMLIGIIFILSGLMLLYKPPKDINGLYGYRTKRSMKNMTLWKEGNEYSAKLLIKYGVLILLLGSVLSFLVKRTEYALLSIVSLMVMLAIFIILRVEKRLKHLEKTSDTDLI